MKYILTINKEKYKTEDVAILLKNMGVNVSSVFTVAGCIIVEHYNKSDLMVEGVTHIMDEPNKTVLLD